MKIYNKVVIDIGSGETLFEDSYEYDGEIAKCGWDSPSVGDHQSPEQAAVYNALMPILNQLAGTSTPTTTWVPGEGGEPVSPFAVTQADESGRYRPEGKGCLLLFHFRQSAGYRRWCSEGDFNAL